MTYQGSFTTQQDILLYQQPQPQQPAREKPWDPHPEVGLIFKNIHKDYVFITTYLLRNTDVI